MTAARLTPWERWMVSVQKRQQLVSALFKELDYKPGAGLSAYARVASFIHEDEAGLDEALWELARKTKQGLQMDAIIALALATTTTTCELHRWLYQHREEGIISLLGEAVRRREPLLLQLAKLQGGSE